MDKHAANTVGTDADARYNTVDRKNRSAYLREFIPAMIGYMVTLVLVISFVDFDTAGWWKYLVALVPIVPAAFIIRAIARSVQRSDEFARAAQLKGMSLGFGVAMFALVTMGMLSIAGLNTEPGGYWVVFSVSMLAWGLGGVASVRGS